MAGNQYNATCGTHIATAVQSDTQTSIQPATYRSGWQGSAGTFGTKCSDFDYLAGSEWYIRVQMNGYTSFFKPSSSDVSYCDMITTHNKQSFSTTGNAGSFVSATGRSDHLGGYYYQVDGVTQYAISWGVQPWAGVCSHPLIKHLLETCDICVRAGNGGHNYKGGCCPWESAFTIDIFVDHCEGEPLVSRSAAPLIKHLLETV